MPTRPLILLAYPKIDHERDYVYFWSPFSLLAIAKPVLDEGLAEVVVFDGNQARPGDWERFLDQHLDAALCVGFSIMTGGGQIGHALDMISAAKSRSKCPPVVVGGPHVNVLPTQTAEHPLIDIALKGPGQTSLPALVRALTGRDALSNVPGLHMRTGSKVTVGPDNPPRAAQLGQYPWHLVRVEDYVRDDPCIATRTMNYVSSQGCVYKCRFCFELTYQRKWSALKAPDLLEDIRALCQQHSINGIKFYYADWFIDLRRSMAFAEGLIDRGPAIRWAASINPNDVLKARGKSIPLLSTIAQSGCQRLLMGVESGSDRVLNEIVQKEITRAQVLEVAREIASNGIIGSYTFITGFPGETKSEIAETYAFIEELRTLSPTPETRVHLFAPYPGTPLFDVALSYGYQPPKSLAEWSNYNYYESQTPWTDEAMVATARGATRMRKPTQLRVLNG